MKFQTIYYQHSYLAGGFQIGDYKPKKTHACLYFGDWCWSNALTNPKMLFRYLKGKMGL